MGVALGRSSARQGHRGGAKLWNRRATLISASDRLIETTDNPLWLESDALLRALLILAVGAGLLLIFAWHWGAVPALGSGQIPIDTTGAILGNEGIGADPTRLVLRPLRRSDAPEGTRFGSLGATAVVARILALMLPFLGVLVVGNPPLRHQRLIFVAPAAGVLVAAFAVFVVWRELYLRLGSLFADAQDFGATNWLGIARRYPRSQLQRIVVSYLDYPRGGTRAVVLFVSNSGSVLMRRPGRWWRRDQVQRLASFLGVQAENLWDPGVPVPPVSPVTPDQLRAQFRGAMPYWTAHPTLTALVITPVVIVAVVLLVLAVGSH